MKTRQFILITGAMSILGIISFLIFSNFPQKSSEITNILPTQTKTLVTDFSSCVAAGNPIIESYPRQCRSDETTFTEDIGNTLEKSNLKNPSYEEIIGFVNKHITEIIGAYSSKKAVNEKWFVDGFGFTSVNHVYVDFEDGHFLFRVLLECSYENSIISCTPLAILEKQKEEGWITTK